MWVYVVKRFLHMIPILLGVSLLTFMLTAFIPGDYFTKLTQNPQVTPDMIERMRTRYHLDKPWYVRYGYWLKNVTTRFDFGESIEYKRPARELITARLWNTFVLSLTATIIAWGVAVPLGIWAAVHKDSWIDRFCALIAFVGLSVPEVLL